MSYQVLARKWRPKSFDTLIGQESAVQAIANALDQNRLHHAYLFNGTRGIGKTTIARILAKSLNCEKGISSKPCLTCSTCQEIDVGRYVDLIELDAASNTGVDNMIDLLENAQYAPSSGRFKVYIIDEVHMLSKSAFNAMLKTLEEPPEHVKFILATTEPQKVPITVLSRCLQFNLKQMTSENIANHLSGILTEEKIASDDSAIRIIAKAANGSMRDALSILDQAIAYSSEKISAEKVTQMLGTIEDDILFDIIRHLIDKNGRGLTEIARGMDEKNTSFDDALNGLAKLIHELTVCKIIPGQYDDSSKKALYNEFSEKLTGETLQLFYQISINGRKDLHLAPDPATGFSMTLLRMLAFYPSSTSTHDKVDHSPKPAIKIPEKKSLIPDATEKNIAAKAMLSNTPDQDPVKANQTLSPNFDGNWSLFVSQLKTGVAKTLAQECQFLSYKDSTFHLSLDEKKTYLSKNDFIQKLEEQLINHFNKKLKLEITIDSVSTSPAIEKRTEKAALLKHAESAIMQDNFVKELISDFDAEIVPSSIEPIKKEK